MPLSSVDMELSAMVTPERTHLQEAPLTAKGPAPTTKKDIDEEMQPTIVA